MKKQFFRYILMVAGVLTVFVILLSQSFYQPVENSAVKAKTEQKTGEHHASTNISVPADVVPIAAMQLADNVPTLLKTLALDPESEKIIFPDVEILTPYFSILFGAIISPNAP